VLLEQGAITKEQLENALALQQKTKQKLGELLLEQGILSEELFLKALSEALHTQALTFAQLKPDPAALKLLKPAFCSQHQVFPLGFESQGGRRRLVVALADPLNLRLLEETAFLAGMAISPRLAGPTGIRRAIAEHYHGVRATGESGEFVILRGAGSAMDANQQLGPPIDLDLADSEGAIIPESPAAASPPSPESGEKLATLERRIMALAALMVKRGLLTREEVLEALKKA
jgi:hypothetical protein